MGKFKGFFKKINSSFRYAICFKSRVAILTLLFYAYIIPHAFAFSSALDFFAMNEPDGKKYLRCEGKRHKRGS